MRQGPDHGTQYRSAIFYANAQQQQVAESYNQAADHGEDILASDRDAGRRSPRFYAAEAYHQNYLAQHPNQLYHRDQ